VVPFLLGPVALAGLFVVPGLLGLAVGVTIFILAQRDLARMRKGLMDPTEVEATRRAQGAAVEGVLLSLGFLAIKGSLLLLYMAPFRPN
jgi:hypothetical protein